MRRVQYEGNGVRGWTPADAAVTYHRPRNVAEMGRWEYTIPNCRPRKPEMFCTPPACSIERIDGSSPLKRGVNPAVRNLIEKLFGKSSARSFCGPLDEVSPRMSCHWRASFELSHSAKSRKFPPRLHQLNTFKKKPERRPERRYTLTRSELRSETPFVSANLQDDNLHNGLKLNRERHVARHPVPVPLWRDDAPR